MARLFHREFERRLYRLYDSLYEALLNKREANLFPMLYQVFAYIWSYGIDGCRLLSNPNKERK